MAYSAPNVYLEDVASGVGNIERQNSNVGVMFGVAPAGPINELVKVTSWTEYVTKFASGLESPFMVNQDLSYAVYLFFTNGGKELYVCNVRKTNNASETLNAKKATVEDATTNITLTAYAEGTCYNGIKMDITKSKFFEEETYEAYDAKITFGGIAVVINEVTKDTIIQKINEDMTAKYWVRADGANVTLEETSMTLAGGQDGIDSLTDNDFVTALSLLDTEEEIMLLAVPGRTSSTITTAITSYCDEHMLFPFLDVPSGSTVAEVKEKRRSYSAYGGELAYPWGYINDPTDDTGESLRLVPTSGALMGLYARFIGANGVWVAPAGVNAVIKGFVKLEKNLTEDEIGQLNIAGVVSIVSKKKYGIVAWGARGLNDEKDMRYVTDVLLNYTIKRDLYSGTQFAIFKPNDDKLWTDVTSVTSTYLERLRTDGALKGSSSEAWSVTCNDSNNTEDTIENGYMYLDVAYAPVKPAEFIVVRIAHRMSN